MDCLTAKANGIREKLLVIHPEVAEGDMLEVFPGNDAPMLNDLVDLIGQEPASEFPHTAAGRRSRPGQAGQMRLHVSHHVYRSLYGCDRPVWPKRRRNGSTMAVRSSEGMQGRRPGYLPFA